MSVRKRTTSRQAYELFRGDKGELLQRMVEEMLAESPNADQFTITVERSPSGFPPPERPEHRACRRQS